MDTTTILGLVTLGVAAAGGGALLTIRFTKQKNRTDSNKVVIRDVNTSGDVAGRDINKRK